MKVTNAGEGGAPARSPDGGAEPRIPAPAALADSREAAARPPRIAENGRGGALHVLHVGKYYPPYRGGIESHLHALCRELKKSVVVNVIVANETRRLMDAEFEGVRVRRLPRLFNLASAPVCPTMAAEIRRTAADIVHLHLPNPLASLAYLASGHQGRLVITWHSDIVRQRTIARVLRPLEEAILRRAGALIASSPNYVESSPVLSRNRARCRVIPFGINADAFRSRDAETVTKIRDRYGPHLVLAVGRMVYYKGFEHLVSAMTRVNAHLLIVGDGPLRPKLERQAFDAGVMDRITFLGRVSQEQVVAYYHATDVFVLPSVARSEAFGIAQLEAMACGKPVVNTQLASGVPFVSVDGVTGLTVAPGDAGELAAAMNRLLDDPYLRGKYGAAAARRVRDEFSVERMAERTLGLYHEVIADSGEYPAVAAARVAATPA